MLDLTALNTAIKAKIVATGSLSGLVGKIGYGVLPEGLEYPTCRFTIVTDSIEGAFGHALLSSVRYQFSVFEDDLATGSNLQKAIGTAFHGATLTLSAGTNVSCRVVEGSRLLVEKQEPSGFIYHSIVVVEFRVLS